MNLKIQALAPVLLYLVMWAGYAALLQTTLGWGPATIFGFFCALVAMVTLGLVVAAWRLGRQRKQMQETQLASPRVSGPTVFCGLLEPMNTPVEAPLSGKPCLAWNYEFETSGLDDQGKVDPDVGFEWFGIGQVALQIAMPYGKIPIRAGALFDSLEYERIARKEGAPRAELLQTVTQLKVVSGAANLISMLTDLDGLFADEDGDVRLDYVRGPWTPATAMGRPKLMREKRIEPGMAVTVQGMFDAGKNIVVASRHGVLIDIAGDLEVDQEMVSPWREGLGLFSLMLVINLVVHGLVVLALIRPPDF